MVRDNRFTKVAQYFWVVFAIALTIRGGYLLVVKNGELGNPDSPGYQALAERIQANQSYHIDEIGPGRFPMDLLRPPGYPIFLYLVNFNSETGVSRLQVAIIQSLLGALFAALLAIVVTKLFTRPIGIGAGLIYAIDWITILHTPLLGADFLFSILLTIAIVAYAFYFQKPDTAKWACIAGLLLGGAALVKPAAQVQLSSLLLAWLLWRHRKTAGLLFVLSYFIVAAPWMIRNSQKYEIFSLSTIDTAALYSYMATGAANAYLPPEITKQIQKEELDGMAVPQGIESLTLAQQNNHMKQEAVKLIRQHWPEVIKQGVKGLVLTCLGPGRETLAQSLPKGQTPSRFWSTYLPLTQNLLMWGLVLLGSFALIRTPSMSLHVKILIFSALCLMILPSASALGYSRFRVHAVPLLSVFASIGLAEISKKLRSQI